MARGFINRDFIRQLNDQADIVDLVGRYVQLKKSGSGYQGLCPFHDEKTPSFHVNPQKNFFHCFGCGESGDALGFLMRQDSLEFSDAVHRLADMTGMRVVYDQAATAAPAYDKEFAVLRKASDFYCQQLRSGQGEGARRYLDQRGIAGKLVEDYGLGYAPAGTDALLRQLTGEGEKEAALRVGLIKEGAEDKRRYDFFRGRLLFPIVDLRDRVLGFGGRVLGAGEPKYINSSDSRIFHKGKEFYGAPQALKNKNKTKHLVVVEGYMDVLALAGVGESVLACLGTAFTEDHADRLLRWTDRLIFAFDGDQAGQQAAKRAMVQCLPRLADTKEMSFLFLPAGEDPQSLIQSGGVKAWQGLEPVSLSEFLLRDLKRAGGIEERAQQISKLAAHLSLLPEGSLRSLIRKKAEEIAGTSLPILAEPSESSRRRPPSKALPNNQRVNQPGSRSAQSSGVVSIRERFLSHLIKRPELATELSSDWRALTMECEEGELGQVSRFLAAAEKGAGYLYGYIQGCGSRLLPAEAAANPSLFSLQECIHRLLSKGTKEELRQAIAGENREKVNQAKARLALLTKLWQQEKEKKDKELATRS